jgi:hypothetical protein
MALRMAAVAVGRSDTALRAFYRRLAGRVGKPQALSATARKLAILIYRVLKRELAYRDPEPETYDAQQRPRLLPRLRQDASTLGLELVNRWRANPKCSRTSRPSPIPPPSALPNQSCTATADRPFVDRGSASLLRRV